MGYIYKITCLKNNNLYIGKTAISIEDRWYTHCRAAFEPAHKDKNEPIHKAIRKYGIDNFSITQIEECENDILSEREKYWIKYYNSYKNGYNATLGGDGQLKYDYKEIVDYYNQTQSITDTCKYFKIYDQVVYSALKSYNIDYSSKSSHKINTQIKNRKILCVEENKIFNRLQDVNDFIGKKSAKGNVLRCLYGITEKAYGYHWKEIINNNEEKGD